MNQLTTPETTVTRAKRSTQVIFMVCGLAISSWAPLVPFAKDRLHLNDANLGLLLLFLGGGAIAIMPVTGWLIQKIGTRIVMTIASVVISIGLPLLTIFSDWAVMAATLFIFGAGIGSVDVAMNAHGANVQNTLGKHIMSSLHGLFSVGGLIGPVAIGLLLKAGFNPLIGCSIISALLLIFTLSQYNSLLAYEQEKAINNNQAGEIEKKEISGSAWLNGAVIFIGVLCFIAFLSEGAMLDWGALFLRDNKQVDEALAGVGYACFSIAMATMRLAGDRILARVQSKTVVLAGALIAASGYLCVIYVPVLWISLLGFTLIGAGAANIVPVFFSAAGSMKKVQSSAAVSVISTFGYAGQLAGPAAIGFAAYHFSLPVALLITGLLLLLTGVFYRIFSVRTT